MASEISTLLQSPTRRDNILRRQTLLFFLIACGFPVPEIFILRRRQAPRISTRERSNAGREQWQLAYSELSLGSGALALRPAG